MKWKEKFEATMFYPTTTRTFDAHNFKMQRKGGFPIGKQKGKQEGKKKLN